jgi:hypothetical protein
MLSTQEHIQNPTAAATPVRTKGETYEGIAFTFCKAATIILLTGKWALPIAAGAAAVFYLLAYRHNKRDTRCILREPRLIAAFWGAISLVSLYFLLRPL